MTRVLAPLLVCLFLSVSAVAQPAADTDVTGGWVGVYQVYPNYVQMTLTISGAASGGERSAELRLEGLGGKTGPMMGVGRASVRFDPAARVIDINATGAPFGGLAFHGVYDGQRRALAGYRVGASNDASPYFLLVRQGQEGQAFERLRDMPDGAPPRGGLPGFGGGPGDDELRAWLKPLVTEYAWLDPYNTPYGDLYVLGRNLFRDDNFVKYFGKPYDQLSNRELSRINRKLEGIPGPRGNFPEERPNAAARPMARGFWVNVGTQAAPDIMLSVLALRSIGAWMTQTQQRLPQLSGATALQALAGIAAEDDGVLATFWPSERQAFARALDAQRVRAAEPALRAAVAQAVSAATRFADVAGVMRVDAALATPAGQVPAATSGAGPRFIPRFAPPTPRPSLAGNVAGLAALVTPETRTALRADVATRLATLVDDEAGRDLAALTARPRPGNAVAAIAELQYEQQQHRQLQEKYASFAARDAVRGVLSALVDRRAATLAAAAPALEAIFGRAPDEASLDQVRRQALAMPTDEQDPAARRVLSALDSRRQTLRREQSAARAAQQQIDAVQQKLQAAREADASRRRRAVAARLGSEPPTLSALQNMLVLVPTIKPTLPVADERRFLAHARSMGFELRNPGGDLLSDVNTFESRVGLRLKTFRLDNGFLVELVMPTTPPDLAELYVMEMRAFARDMRKSDLDVSELPIDIDSKSESYISDGAVVYVHKRDGDSFVLMLLDNFDADAAVTSLRVAPDTLRVTSYSRDTDVSLKRGERLRLTATGSVSLGPVAGSAGPAGISGYELYSREDGLPHGALIARIGDGPWMVVGNQRVIEAPANGWLQLRVNDREPGNNRGGFDVVVTKLP